LKFPDICAKFDSDGYQMGNNYMRRHEFGFIFIRQSVMGVSGTVICVRYNAAMYTVDQRFSY